MTVFVEGMVTVRPATHATFKRFIDAFFEAEYPLLVRHGMEVAGAWMRTTGLVNQLLHLYRFEDAVAWAKASSSLRTDPEFEKLQSLYSWVDDSSFRYRRLLRVMAPFSSADRVDLVRQQQPTNARRYVELKQTVAFGRQPEAYELIKRRIEGWESAGVFQLVLAYDTFFGEYGELVIIGVLPDGAPPLGCISDASDISVARRLAQLVSDEQICLLSPMSYSPLR